MAKMVKCELEVVDEVVDLQTEKYKELQKKIDYGKEILIGTSSAIKMLEAASKMKRIIISMFLILIFFGISMTFIKYY